MKEITHKEYLRSPYWITFSRKKLNEIDVCCSMCGRPKWTHYQINTRKNKKGDRRRIIVLNLHHVNYDNLGKGNDNVIALCRRCHLLAHDIERAARTEDFWAKVYLTLLESSNWEFERGEQKGLYIVEDDFKLRTHRKPKGEV